MNKWLWVYDGYDPQKEGLREALCAIGNGYFVTRAAAPESAVNDIHYPGTYLAGVFNELQTLQGTSHVIANEDLVNLPDWLSLTFKVDDTDWFTLESVDILSYRLTLDLKHGVLHRDIHIRDPKGRETAIQERRFASMREPHLGGLQTKLTALNWQGDLRIKTALEGRVVNWNVKRYRGLNYQHLTPVETDEIDSETLYLKVETNQSKIQIAQTARTRVFKNETTCPADRQTHQEAGYIAQELTVEMAQGESVTVEKIMAMYDSRDRAISECGKASQIEIREAPDFEALFSEHEIQWHILWKHFDIHLALRHPSGSEEQDPLAILRLHTFQLLQTASLNTIGLDVDIPSRGWHGEGYRGHYFWDSMFILPFITLRIPEITRSLLLYRYRRLNAARKLAKQAGYRGAMYPWQSGSSGRDVTPRTFYNLEGHDWIKDNSHLERHINATIAYNIWKYYESTQDREFLNFYGAEIILELARFWTSFATYDRQTDRYEINGVIGPDEYHDAYPGAKQPGINNNSYTNIMAVWVISTALNMLEIMPDDRVEELRTTLHLHADELKHWDTVSRKMKVVFQKNGIISQFEGYEQLKELDWDHYRRKYGNIQRMDLILNAENDSPNNYQITKQADVLMLFYVFSDAELQVLFDRLGYDFKPETIPTIVDYYMQRTSDGSTLSHLVDAWVVSRRDASHSWQYFKEALQSDVSDFHGGSTQEGIHLGAMAGTVDIIQRCYTGLVTRNDTLWFAPNLPEEMETLSLQIRYRGHTLALRFDQHAMTIASTPCNAENIRFGCRNKLYTLEAGESKTISTKPAHVGA